MKRRINLFEPRDSKPEFPTKKPASDTFPKVNTTSSAFEDLDPVTMVLSSDSNQFGNHRNYYKKRGTKLSVLDPRLISLDRIVFEDKDVLDVGCHCGLIPLQLGKYFGVKSAKGIDIDFRLINAATENWTKEELREHKKAEPEHDHQSESAGVSVNLESEEETEETSHPSEAQSKANTGMQFHKPAHLAIPSSGGNTTNYPYNVSFQVCNILQLSLSEPSTTSQTPGQEQGETPSEQKKTVLAAQQFDTVLLLSLTKWVHMNFGDDGIRTLFANAKCLLRVGGRLVLEAQKFKAYAKILPQSARFQKVYPNIQLRPEMFEDYLIKQLGFMKEGVYQSLSRDTFKRDLVVFRRVN